MCNYVLIKITGLNIKFTWFSRRAPQAILAWPGVAGIFALDAEMKQVYGEKRKRWALTCLEIW